MKFIAKLWALLVLIGVCSFGSQAYAQTRAEVLSCMESALASDPFSGTRVNRLEQARHQQAGTALTINGEVIQTTAEKPSAWVLCEGPTLQEQLDTANATVQELTTANGKLIKRVGALTKELRTTGGEFTKAKAANADLQHKLDNRSFVSNIQWLVMVVLAFALILLAYDPQITAWQESRHQRSVHKRAKRHVDFTPEPQSVRNDAAPGDDTAPDSGPRHAGQH